MLLNVCPVNSPLLATEVVEAELCPPSSCPLVAAGVDPPSAVGSELPSVPAPSGVVLSASAVAGWREAPVALDSRPGHSSTGSGAQMRQTVSVRERAVRKK